MNILDWTIVIIPIFVVIFFGIKACRLATSVADFLAARRVAGRYLLCVANLEAGQGLVSLVSMWEMYFVSGFAIVFWYNLTAPLALVFSLFGYCIYRFRETKAMTLGQFLEMRYNRKFRVAAAFIQVFAGIFSYSLFPAVGARCIMYFCDLPVTFQLCGMVCSTYVSLILIFLSVASLAVCMGGQVTVMVTDCIQGLISYPLYAILVFYVISRFSWGNDVVPALLNRPVGQSMVNPYDISQLRDFNLFWVATGILGAFLGRMCWSGSQGYQSAALNPHEQKMGMMLGGFRAGFASLMTLTLAIGGITLLSGANFTRDADRVRLAVSHKVIHEMLTETKYNNVRSELQDFLKSGRINQNLQNRLKKNKHYTQVPTVTPRNISYIIQSAVETIDPKKAQSCESIARQMLIPVTVRHILPHGLLGVMCVIMLFLMFSTDTTSLHSWGSILMQDLILPFYNKILSKREHIFMLRISICIVALCAFCGSVLFEQTDYILMFFTIATAVWMAGSGPAITLGLYWRKGTAAGAFASLFTGAGIALGGILLQQNWARTLYPFLERNGLIPGLSRFFETVSRPFHPYILWKVTPNKFPINSMEINFIALLMSLIAYLIVSLITCHKVYDLNALLNRDKQNKTFQWTRVKIINRLLGIDEHYTRGDKIIAHAVFFWSFVWGFGISFVGIIVWNHFFKWPDSWWCTRVLVVMIIVPSIVALITTIWFGYGSIIDLGKMFSMLRSHNEDTFDNGQVSSSQSSIKKLKKKSFTLLELLIVIFIIALLAGLLMPVLNRGREKARSTQCLNNLRQLGWASSMYSQDNKSVCAPGYISDSSFSTVYWFPDLIYQYFAQHKMYICPSFSYTWNMMRPMGNYPAELKFSYGRSSTSDGFGYVVGATGYYIKNENSVKRPSQMIALCDSIAINLSPESSYTFGGSGMRINFVHTRMLNAVFQDCHVESMKHTSIEENWKCQ